MKRITRACLLVLLVALCLLTVACRGQEPSEEDEPVWLTMNTNYPKPEGLTDGQGKPVKVILLLGQSNATGCSISEYLKLSVGEEQYAIYES
jgi:cytochrome oxidase Cu insertion factor (SCO1/SenC/PrrC family)